MSPVLFPYPAAALVAVLLLVPLLRRWAVRSNFVDQPGGRKKHEDAVPPVGGLAVFPAFMAVAAFLLMGGEGRQGGDLWFFIALLILLVTGAVDDRYNVAARYKFAMQFVAALLIIIPGEAQVTGLGNLFGPGSIWMGWMGIPFSVIATVLLINAINLMDGLDGLAAGTCFIIMFWMAVCCLVAGQAGNVALLAVAMAALGGFLFYNLRHPWRERAAVFLGDAGSLALGLTIAWFSLHLSKLPGPPIRPITVAWLLALPIYDTCGQFARRIGNGRHPFDADHHHFHHHFIYAGLPVRRATACILLVVFLNGLFGVGGILLGAPEYVMAYLWIAGLFVHIYMSMRPHRFRRLLARTLGGAGRGGKGAR